MDDTNYILTNEEATETRTLEDFRPSEVGIKIDD
jgi:hypothetical protein